MNIALVYNDVSRYWTVGSYLKRVLADQDHVNICAHCRIPEDTGILEEQNGLDLDLILIPDSSVHYKLHHHQGKLGKAKTVFWISDLHRPDWAKWRLQMIREFKYDHIFYAQKNFKQMILDCGYEEYDTTWLPHAVDPSVFFPMLHITKRYDIGFVGYMNEKREKAINTLQEYMRFKHFHSVWAWTANRCINELKIGFNISVESDINMRMFETMACGIPLLTNKIEDNGMEDLFGDKEEYMLTYADVRDMKERAVRLIANPSLREHLGQKGKEHVLKNHTYKNRMNTILATLRMDVLK